MLVVGQREGFLLRVHYAWRIYASRVNVVGADTLIEWLQRFADQYGAEMEIEGKRGHFFLTTSGATPEKIQFEVGPKRHVWVTVSKFVQKDPETKENISSLVMAIDLEKYNTTLDELWVRREDILDEFVPAAARALG
jgi:hypothetical protein